MEDKLPPDSPETIASLYKDLQEREENLKRPIINKDTLIPIGVLGVIAGIVWFAATVSADLAQAKNDITELKKAIVGFTQMQSDVAVIKSQMETVIKAINSSKEKF